MAALYDSVFLGCLILFIIAILVGSFRGAQLHRLVHLKAGHRLFGSKFPVHPWELQPLDSDELIKESFERARRSTGPEIRAALSRVERWRKGTYVISGVLFVMILMDVVYG